MQQNIRIQEFEDFFTSVLGCTKESFDPNDLILQESTLQEALEMHASKPVEDTSIAELQSLCRDTQDLLAHFINKRDRLSMLPSLTSKDENASRSCERTLHQCCMVLSEEIEALDKDHLTVLDELEASIQAIRKIQDSSESTAHQNKVDNFLRLNDIFLESVFNYDGLHLSDGNKNGELRPGCSAVTIKSCLESIKSVEVSTEDQIFQQKMELSRLQTSFQMCEAERFSVSNAVAMSEASLNSLDEQFKELCNSKRLGPVSTADNVLLERQAETQELQRQAATLYNEIISPLIRQLGDQQGVKFMRGACKLRLIEEQHALSSWSRLQALSEWQQARLEMLEACLELDKVLDGHADELIAAATEHITRAAADKARVTCDVCEPALTSQRPKATEPHIGDFRDDCERIFSVLGADGDKFAMAFPTPSDVLAAARRVGSAGPKAVTDRAALIEAHATLWSSLRRTANAYDRTLYTMSAGPGQPIGMPSDLEEALHALTQAGGEADRNLEAVLKYRDSARQAGGLGAGAAGVVANFFTQPERLHEEMEVLRARCAATGWCPPPVPSAHAP